MISFLFFIFYFLKLDCHFLTTQDILPVQRLLTYVAAPKPKDEIITLNTVLNVGMDDVRHIIKKLSLRSVSTYHMYTTQMPQTKFKKS